MNAYFPVFFLKLIVFLFIVFVCKPVLAQEDSASVQPPISTARPSMTEGTATMRKGFFQIETGFVYEKVDYTNSYNEELRYPTTFLRYGLFKNVELRLSGQYVKSTTKYVDQPIPPFEYAGMDDLTFSTKVNLFHLKKIKTNVSTAAFLTVPSGSGEISSNNTYPSFFILVDQGLFRDWSFSYNLGLQISSETTSSFIYTLMLPIPWINSYVELYGNVDYSRIPIAGEPDNYLVRAMSYAYVGAGTTYLIKNNIQLDVSGGYCISNNLGYSSFYLSTGISFRLPK